MYLNAEKEICEILERVKAMRSEDKMKVFMFLENLKTEHNSTAAYDYPRQGS